ncbi:blue copper protein [Tanacetum coccineum]
MEQWKKKMWIVIVFMMTTLINSNGRGAVAGYKNYTVGGDLGWFDKLEKSTVDYQKWASSKTFSLGDFLIFNTDNNHTVVQTYNYTIYTLCDDSGALDNDTINYASPDPSAATVHPVSAAVPLLKVGPTYFFSSFYDGGMPLQHQNPLGPVSQESGDDTVPDTIVPANFDHPKDLSGDDDDDESDDGKKKKSNGMVIQSSRILLLVGYCCLRFTNEEDFDLHADLNIQVKTITIVGHGFTPVTIPHRRMGLVGGLKSRFNTRSGGLWSGVLLRLGRWFFKAWGILTIPHRPRDPHNSYFEAQVVDDYAESKVLSDGHQSLTKRSAKTFFRQHHQINDMTDCATFVIVDNKDLFNDDEVAKEMEEAKDARCGFPIAGLNYLRVDMGLNSDIRVEFGDSSRSLTYTFTVTLFDRKRGYSYKRPTTTTTTIPNPAKAGYGGGEM